MKRKGKAAGQRFLIGALAGALNTANAKVPLSRSGRSSMLCFFPSWLTSELPLHTVAFQAVGVLRHIKRGALQSKEGWAAVAVTAGSWWGLRSVWKEGKAAREVLNDALAPVASEVEELSIADRPIADARRQLLLGPADLTLRQWVCERGISYGEHGRRNTLDIWRRGDLQPGDNAPVLVQVHGGGWVIGNKQQQAMPLMAQLASLGWVCVSINYRLSPRATWPDHIVDVKRAIAWTKQHIAAYGGDPNFVAITGGSAGGHLCSLAALSANAPEFQPGFEGADTSVACAVPFYGVYDFTNRDGTGLAEMEDMLTQMVMKVPRKKNLELWDHASSMSWVNDQAPPFFLLHGTNDVLVPVEQARSFVAMLRDASNSDVLYAELPGTQHAFDVFASPRALGAVDAVTRFLSVIHRRYQDGIESSGTSAA